MFFFWVVVLSSLILFLIWFLYCNEKTYKERIAMINRKEIGGIWSVSFQEHLWTLVFFRNIETLYTKRRDKIRSRRCDLSW